MLEFIPGKVFVVGVSLLIGFIAYSSQLMIFLPAYGGWTQESLILIPLNLLVLMTYYNYYLAVTTDPGKIPKNWEPPSDLIIEKEIVSEGITGPRYCKTCKVYKPPRSHHCRYCKRCVLKMDHHCPWINNCVGYDNYGHFIRFIIYANTACAFVICLLIGRVRAVMRAIRHFEFDAEPDTTTVVFMVLNFILAFCVLFAVGILMLYQIYCLLKNQSNVDALERDRVETLVRRGKIAPVRYPYDVGVYENICQVLGPNPLCWLWPQKVRGDGIHFPVLPGTDPRLPYYWPPRDPEDLRPSIFSARYKRQQEIQRQLRENPEQVVDYESEGYYDSGSFITDDDLSHDEEERELFESPTTYTPYYQPLDSSGSDDESIPLSQIVSTKKSSFSKQD